VLWTFFPKLKMADAAILDLFAVSHETTHEGAYSL